MSDGEIIAVLEELVGLLDANGYSDRAAWLRERQRRLDGANQPTEVDSVRNELHSIVLGMGGLYDLTLTPDEESGRNQEAEETRLDELANQLYSLTEAD